MFDFGDELTIESFRTPWLIWIQILVLLLLMLLLHGFTLFALDLPETSSSSSSSSSSSPDSKLGKIPVFKQTTKLASPCFQASQVGEKQSLKGEIDVTNGTSGRIVRGGGEESEEVEGSSRKEANQNWYHHHPCHYLRLAKLAFLKCFGLDLWSSDHNPSITEQQRNQR